MGASCLSLVTMVGPIGPGVLWWTPQIAGGGSVAGAHTSILHQKQSSAKGLSLKHRLRSLATLPHLSHLNHLGLVGREMVLQAK